MEEIEIVRRIKALRTQKGLSLEKLAQLTGLTKGYLSRIENSEKAPPIYTLSRISRAMGLDITQFFTTTGSPEPKPYAITRRDGRIKAGGRGSMYGYDYEAIAPDMAGKNMDPYVVTVGFDKRAEFQHEGEELLFVLEGEIEFYLDDERFVLSEGDSIYFDSGKAHSGRSLGDTGAKLLIVIYSYRKI